MRHPPDMGGDSSNEQRLWQVLPALCASRHPTTVGTKRVREARDIARCRDW